MITNIKYGNDAIDSIKEGINYVAKAVKETLGAGGRNVIIRNMNQFPFVTKDGVTVAKNIFLEDEFEAIGAELLKEVALNTNEEAGDGTTGSVVLTEAILTAGIKYINSGYNVTDIKDGINDAVKQVVEQLDIMSIDLVDEDSRLESVATISANNNEKIGKLVSEVVSKVGVDGIVNINDGNNSQIEVEYTEGLKIDKGWLSPYFVTNISKMRSELKDVMILVTDKVISAMKDILPTVEYVMKEGKTLLVIADDIDGEALATLIYNRRQANLNVFAIKAPENGQNKLNMLKDICTYTGATFISQDAGDDFSRINPAEVLGHAKKAVLNKEDSVITDGGGNKVEIAALIEDLTQVAKDGDEFDKIRVAKLKNNIANINVGAVTESEMKEVKYLIEDAVNATFSALEEGIVPGGGVALFRAKDSIRIPFVKNGYYKGKRIIRDAVSQPLYQIIDNSNTRKLRGKRVGKKIQKESTWVGYNVKNNQYENFLNTGIIDPKKVIRVALENAASVACSFLTTSCVISNDNRNNG